MKKNVFRKFVSGLLCLLLMGMYIPAVNAQAGDSLFLDDFSASSPRWTVVGGQMNVQNGVALLDGTDAVKQTNPDADVLTEHQYAWVDGVGKDVTITVKVKPITLAGVPGKEERLGIIAHTKGGGEGDTKWCVLLSQGKLKLLEEVVSWRGETPFAYSVGNTYLLKVMVQKNKLSAKVWQEGNPEPTEWMLQNTFTTQLEEDGVGVYYANCVAEFDDFLVQQSPESPPALLIDRVKPGNVFTEGETPSIRIKLDNSTNLNTQGSYTVEYNVTDYLGKPVDSGSRIIDVTPGTTPTADIMLDTITQKGSYGVEIAMKSSDTVIDRKSTSVALIDAGSSGLTQESPFGIGSYGGFLGSRFDEQKLADTYTMMEKMGVKWTREEIFWDEMRPTKDSQYIWEKFDQTVTQAREHHINIMGIVDYWAKWSIPYDNDPNRSVDWPTAIANYKQYAMDLAKRYMPGGDLVKEQGWTDNYGITSWELWNEPPTFWFGTAEQFGQLVKAASEGIRSVDPNAIIISSSQDDTFDKTVLDIAGFDAYKALAIHIYPGAVNPDASEYARIVRDKRAFLDSNGASDKQIWITETGWNTIGQVTQLQQAQNIVRANVLTIAAGVNKVFTFTFNYNNSSEGWGVVEENLDPKVSYSAYSAMTHRLEGKQFSNELTMGSAVKGFVFANSSISTTTLWTTKGTATLSVTPPQGAIYSTYDFMGNLLGQYTNTFDINLSESPIYLEATGVASQDMANTVQNGIISGMDTVDITVSDLSDLPIAGNHPTIDVTITNNINVSQQGKVSIELPEGWRVKNKTIKFDSIAIQASQKITFELVKFKKHDDGQYPVVIMVQTDKGRTVKKVILYLTAAQRFTPVIDGSNSEWLGQLKVGLNTPDKVVGIVGWTPSNLSAEASTAWDDQYFYLNVEATDNIHNQPYKDWGIWQGDSLQFFFDPNNDKLDSGDVDDVQYGAALSNDGTVVFINYTTGQVTSNLKGTVVRDEVSKKTIYEIAVPWSELNIIPSEGMKMGFNFMLNDNDGAGRTGWINWKEGIGNSYNPSKWSSWELTSQLQQTIRLGCNGKNF